MTDPFLNETDCVRLDYIYDTEAPSDGPGAIIQTSGCSISGDFTNCSELTLGIPGSDNLSTFDVKISASTISNQEVMSIASATTSSFVINPVETTTQTIDVKLIDFVGNSHDFTVDIPQKLKTPNQPTIDFDLNANTNNVEISSGLITSNDNTIDVKETANEA